jgi:nitrite reductase/ring-hydroxylating ferredoxin subunit
MSSGSIEHHSLWVETELPRFPALDRDIEVEVVVVGAGVTGITAASLLRQAGVRVALIDRAQVAGGDSARTTAHLTYVTDQRLHHLASKLGNDAARSFWGGGAAAIDQIWKLVQESGSDCEFAWVPGYLHEPAAGANARERDHLRADAELAREFGFDAQYIDKVPFAGGAGADEAALSELANGEGRILKLHGKKVAAYRDERGEITVCSPVCTHLKCLVHWNRADRSWDCPCHGSRFHPTGEVLSGPAEAPLERLS